jgi:hypothetical protein
LLEIDDLIKKGIIIKMNVREESLKKHYEWQGKIEVISRVKVEDSPTDVVTEGLFKGSGFSVEDEDRGHEIYRLSYIGVVPCLNDIDSIAQNCGNVKHEIVKCF